MGNLNAAPPAPERLPPSSMSSTPARAPPPPGAPRVERVRFKERQCRSCFSLHDPRGSGERAFDLERNLTRSHVAALFQPHVAAAAGAAATGAEPLACLTMSDFERLVLADGLRAIPELHGKSAVQIMRYLNRSTSRDRARSARASSSTACMAGETSEAAVTREDFEPIITAWVTQRIALRLAVASLYSMLKGNMESSAVAVELARGHLDDLVPELYGMDPTRILNELHVTGPVLRPEELIAQLTRITVTERVSASFAGYENVVQKQALCLFNKYNLSGESEIVPKQEVFNWVCDGRLNLSAAQERAPSAGQPISLEHRRSLANHVLGALEIAPDAEPHWKRWTRTELMMLLRDVGPQTSSSVRPMGAAAAGGRDPHATTADTNADDDEDDVTDLDREIEEKAKSAATPLSYVKLSEDASLPPVYCERGMWSVTVHEARNLPDEGLGDTTDSYVWCYSTYAPDGPTLQEAFSEVIKDQANPSYRGMKYERIASIEEVVVIELWDQDLVGSGNLIGQCVLCVEGIQNAAGWRGGVVAQRGVRHSAWVDLRTKSVDDELKTMSAVDRLLHDKGALGAPSVGDPRVRGQVRIDFVFEPLVPALCLLPGWPRVRLDDTLSLPTQELRLVGDVSTILPPPAMTSGLSRQTSTTRVVTYSLPVVQFSPHSIVPRLQLPAPPLVPLPHSPPSASARLSFAPAGLVCDADGALMVCERARGCVMRVALSGEMRPVAGRLDGLLDPVAIIRLQTQPAWFVVADAKQQCLFQMVPLEAFGYTVPYAYTVSEFGPRGVFQQPAGLACDSRGFIYVADAATHLVHMIAPGGEAHAVLAGSRFAGDNDGLGRMASFRAPTGLFCDASDALLVTQMPGDGHTSTVKKVARDGTVTTLAGRATATTPTRAGERVATWRDGLAQPEVAFQGFSQPVQVASALRSLKVEHDDLVVAGAREGKNAARNAGLAAIAGGKLRWSAGAAADKLAQSEAAERVAQFGPCAAIVADATGNIFVADTGNRCIRHISPAGIVTTIAGAPLATADYADGRGNEARFRTPVALALGPSRAGQPAVVLYVSDPENECIRRIVLHDLDRTRAATSPASAAAPASASSSSVPTAPLDASPSPSAASGDDDDAVRAAALSPLSSPEARALALATTPASIRFSSDAAPSAAAVR